VTLKAPFDRTIEPGKMGGKPCIRGLRILSILASYSDRREPFED